MTATANLANLAAYLAGDTVSGANPAEGLTSLASLSQAAQSLGEVASKAGVSVERAYFAAALTAYAASQTQDKPLSPSGALDAVCASHPIPGYGGTPKQRKTCVRAGMLAHAERFMAVVQSTDEAAIVGQALDYARQVNLRAERDNRAAASARPSKGSPDKVSDANPAPAPVSIEDQAKAHADLTQALIDNIADPIVRAHLEAVQERIALALAPAAAASIAA